MIWLADQPQDNDNDDDDDKIRKDNSQKSNESEKDFLKKELARLDALEELAAELRQDDLTEGLEEDDDDDDDDWLDLFGTLPEEADPEELAEMELFLEEYGEGELEEELEDDTSEPIGKKSAALEEALLQGVVPADAGVGSARLAGDFGFDPLNLSTQDYIGRIHQNIWDRLPQTLDNEPYSPPTTNALLKARPTALILRDYREAEIRHSRLAMLAAFFWPLQEMLDRFLLDDDQYGPLLYGGVTLPYIPLIMTAIMLLLGYLDIYSKTIKEVEDLGEAFLPGDCFWDPLAVLQGAPDRMKRNMQERELFNGRMAMLAVAVFCFEEITTGKPLIDIPGNELLFEPAYQIPSVQQWLDSVFETPSPTFTFPEVGTVDFIEMEREHAEIEVAKSFSEVIEP